MKAIKKTATQEPASRSGVDIIQLEKRMWAVLSKLKYIFISC